MNTYVEDFTNVFEAVEAKAKALAELWECDYVLLPHEFSLQQLRLEFVIKLRRESDVKPESTYLEASVRGTAWHYDKIRIRLESFVFERKSMDANGFVTTVNDN